MKKVTVFCGESIQEKCGKQLHPVAEVQNANTLVCSNKNEVAYSNNSDFISAVKYIGKKQDIETEFFLNGKSCGDDIDSIFDDLNRALDMIHELGTCE